MTTPQLYVCLTYRNADAALDFLATLARALAAGATQLDEVHEPPHGGRSVAVRDAEGNLWNIDSYAGEEPPA